MLNKRTLFNFKMFLLFLPFFFSFPKFFIFKRQTPPQFERKIPPYLRGNCLFTLKSPVTAKNAGLRTKNTNSNPCLAPQTPPINSVKKLLTSTSLWLKNPFEGENLAKESGLVSVDARRSSSMTKPESLNSLSD